MRLVVYIFTIWRRMYNYNKKRDLYEFNGDFTQYLIDIGVEPEHIVQMKQKVLQGDRGIYQNYPSTESEEYGYVTLVPLDKVIGTSRGTVGWSVYENVRKMYISNREPQKFENCFNFLKGMTLNDLRLSYENLCYPVDMEYYVDDDEYYLYNNGNHRTLTAMLLGAKNIKARVVNAYCDLEKKEKYEYAQAFIKKYKIVRIMSYGIYYDLEFRDEEGVYEIKRYEGIRRNESMYDLVNRLSQVIEEDKAIVMKIQKFPLVIQRIIYCFSKNTRIRQYVEKTYLSEDEQCFWNNRNAVYLYNL